MALNDYTNRAVKPEATMATLEATQARTLIDAAAEHVPHPKYLGSCDAGHIGYAVHTYAVPKGWELKHINTEEHCSQPLRLRAIRNFGDLESLSAYLKTHATKATAIWANLDAFQSTLSISACIDDHQPGIASWQDHHAKYTPSTSVEWDRWKRNSGIKMSQIEFGNFLEDNIADIATVDGMPSGDAMLAMALNFEAKADMRIKSNARLQNGGVSLEFVSDDDKATIERMEMFSRFAIGVPVFWGGSRFQVNAKLRYAYPGGKPQFWFELQRSDRVYEAAAKDVLNRLREQLPDVPLYIGR